MWIELAAWNSWWRDAASWARSVESRLVLVFPILNNNKVHVSDTLVQCNNRTQKKSRSKQAMWDTANLASCPIAGCCHLINLVTWSQSLPVCNFHTCALRHVRSLLTDDVAQTVACSIVASRLDYYNALLSGAPAATVDKLQRAQNNLARVVCQSSCAATSVSIFGPKGAIQIRCVVVAVVESDSI